MKTIGLIGGMSWESSAEYYRMINEAVRERLGGLHSAQCVMYSVDFAVIEALQHDGRWDEAGAMLGDVAARLDAAGADVLVLCTNTMHKVADAISARTTVPLLHIADATAEQIVARGIRRVGLLGTQFTMEQDFYKGRLESRYGLDVVVPDAAERAIIHRVIYDELCRGIVRDTSREQYKADHGPPQGTGCGGYYPGLYRNNALDRSGGFEPAAVRHDCDPCHRRCGCCAGIHRALVLRRG